MDTGLAAPLDRAGDLMTFTDPDPAGAWSVRTLDLPALALRLPVPSAFEPAGPILDDGVQRELAIAGPSPAELLVVSYLPGSNATGDLGAWVDGLVALAGLPIPQLVGVADLVSFGAPSGADEEAAAARVAARLGVDDVRRYHGVAALRAEPAVLLHIYVLTARRGADAWKIALALRSDLLDDDHARASAVFGGVALRGTG
jgi:hypothetical protein